MKKLIIANWKMNPATVEEAVALTEQVSDGVSKLSGVTVVIAPPFVFLAPVARILKTKTYSPRSSESGAGNPKPTLGAQDVFWEESGAYTGEVSAHELQEVGVQYVIIGHSERRAMGETDLVVNKKLRAVLEGGLTAVLCVGESKEVRAKGITAAQAFVKQQLKAGMKGIKNWKFGVEHNVIIAYEPVWAIGTGEEDDPQDAAVMTRFIKQVLVTSYKLQVAVLYGGSTDAVNVAEYIETRVIDGALVGSASLQADEFIAMARNIARVA